MAVAADYTHAWQGQPLLRAYDMHDSVGRVAQREIFYSVLPAVSLKHLYGDSA